MNRRSILILSVAAPTATFAAGIDTANWIEQVELHDGQMIDVSRTARRQDSGFPSYRRGPVIDYELSYGQARWHGPWNRIPASFELFDGVPHLMVFIGDPVTCTKKQPEEYAALFFKFVNGSWVEVSQKELPTSRAFVNLVEDFWGHTSNEDPKGRLSWAQKAIVGDINASHPYTVDSFFAKYQNRLCRWVRR
jgi:hypothetical protein